MGGQCSSQHREDVIMLLICLRVWLMLSTIRELNILCKCLQWMTRENHYWIVKANLSSAKMVALSWCQSCHLKRSKSNEILTSLKKSYNKNTTAHSKQVWWVHIIQRQLLSLRRKEELLKIFPSSTRRNQSTQRGILAFQIQCLSGISRLIKRK